MRVVAIALDVLSPLVGDIDFLDRGVEFTKSGVAKNNLTNAILQPRLPQWYTLIVRTRHVYSIR